MPTVGIELTADGSFAAIGKQGVSIESVSAVKQAIQDKGLDWQAKDYAQDRSYGAILKGRSTGLSHEPIDEYFDRSTEANAKNRRK